MSQSCYDEEGEDLPKNGYFMWYNGYLTLPPTRQDLTQGQ